jgi:hypothetical protein
MSSLSEAIKRTSEVLKQGASTQVLDYEQRFSCLKTLYDDLLSGFIRMQFKPDKAHETAEEFFGTSTIRFAGVDGTMYSRPLFDLVIFFGGAYASTGTITFHEKELPNIKYDAKTIQQAAGISSVVPIYVNEIPEVDHTFFENEDSDKIDPNQQLTDQSIINNATIANWIMTFAEYYLAYKLITDPNQKIRIMLLDRSLSIDRASLIYDTAKRELWKTRSSLIGYRIGDSEPFDINDFTIARQSVWNEALGLPPPRGDYLGHPIIQSVKTKGPLTEKQIQLELKIEDEKRAKRVARQLKRLLEEQMITEENQTFRLNPKYTDVPERIKSLVKKLGDQFFLSKTVSAKTPSVMKVLIDGKEQWLKTIDIAFLTLFTMHIIARMPVPKLV